MKKENGIEKKIKENEKQLNEIAPGIFIVRLSLLIPKEKKLIIGDLQLGYESMMNRQGILMPWTNFEDINKELMKTFGKIKADFGIEKLDEIIINGDLKHEFSKVSEQEWREILKMVDFLHQHCSKITIVKGNHDTFLGPVTSKRNVEIKEHCFIESKKLLISHGHDSEKIEKNEDFKKADTLIIGHEHPSISLKEGTKTEKYKCFLQGKYRNKILVVQPSLSMLTKGTDILEGNHLSQYLNQNLSNFRIWLFEDKIYYFGKVKDLAI